jgi:arabinogalactan endo-1,4-beta-galactosidase
LVGFSYYPLWHTTVPVNDLSEKIRSFRTRYQKDVIILETGYPCTTLETMFTIIILAVNRLTAYPKTQQGQYEIMVKLTSEVKAGGGVGIIYWEPAWISSSLKDLWGTGSSWENCTFFDFEGNTNKGMDYMEFSY